MSDLNNALVSALERERPLTSQVLGHLAEAHDVSREGVAGFLAEGYASLEDYEIDIAFSPLFTPGLSDQADFAALLGGKSLPRQEWDSLVAVLAARPTLATFVTPEGTRCRVPLRPVTIERFVHRLRLDGSIPPDLMALFATVTDEETQRVWFAIARRAIWETPGRQAILRRTLAPGIPPSAEGVELLRIMESYEPADATEALARLPAWLKGIQEEMRSLGDPRPFFNERVQDMHGGGRDRRDTRNEARLEALRRTGTFLERWHRVLSA
jgi:hypothetical protein